MILTVIVTALLEIALAALCFTAGCVYWDITNPIQKLDHIRIEDDVNDFLKANKKQLRIWKSYIKNNSLCYWVMDEKDVFKGSLITQNPLNDHIEVSTM